MERINRNITRFVIISVIVSFFNEVWAQDTLFVMPSAKEIDVSVTSLVTEDTSGFRYTYQIESNEDSEQNVFEFYVECDSDVFSVAAPSGWEGFPSDVQKRVVMWGSRDSVYDIPPGKELLGLSFTSFGLPSILNFYARGAFEEPIFPEGQAPPIDSVMGIDIFDNSVKGKSIGPRDVPDSLIPQEFVVDLISYKHRAVDLGWIDNEGIANSLNATLENVKKQLEKGKTKTAKNVLKAFLNEVEAQKDKHLSSEAYALLKFNGEFLLGKL